MEDRNRNGQQRIIIVGGTARGWATTPHAAPHPAARTTPSHRADGIAAPQHELSYPRARAPRDLCETAPRARVPPRSAQRDLTRSPPRAHKHPPGCWRAPSPGSPPPSPTPTPGPPQRSPTRSRDNAPRRPRSPSPRAGGRNARARAPPRAHGRGPPEGPHPGLAQSAPRTASTPSGPAQSGPRSGTASPPPAGPPSPPRAARTTRRGRRANTKSASAHISLVRHRHHTGTILGGLRRRLIADRGLTPMRP